MSGRRSASSSSDDYFRYSQEPIASQPLHLEEEDDIEDFSDEEDSGPLCSVLITVIDHVMVDPTPLEEEEFQDVNAAYVNPSEKESNSLCKMSDLEKLSTPSMKKSDVLGTPGLDAPKPSSPKIQVPLMRIFGPIIRRRRRSGSSSGILEPQQSACLYIHGAFPYLLARPVIAGPDGSIHRSVLNSGVASYDAASSQDTGSFYWDEAGQDERMYTDWDSVEAVERLIPAIQRNLEESIRSSILHGFGRHGIDETASTNPYAQQQMERRRKQLKKVIRRITVVVGRGFYGYTPGPPAPFLRVEYYDPSQRWRVKASLERGLSVPIVFHPDPLQYQATDTSNTEAALEISTGTSSDRDDISASDTLKFHCYEAHIPYTMQFFKDWNLSGMSYVHISKALFRRPLPQSPSRRSPLQDHCNDEALFLESNISEDMIWSSPEKILRDTPASVAGSARRQSRSSLGSSPMEDIGKLQQASQSSNFSSEKTNIWSSLYKEQSGSWSDKISSCDIELDASVDCILNINDVMKDIPDDRENQQSIHWRAVPSLREIWREERRRMAKLLRPEDDFLSLEMSSRGPGSTPPFTLDVKKDSSLPGARLACDGMHRLLHVTEGLEANFRRCMKDVVDRHSKDVEHIDRLIRQRRKHGHLGHEHADAMTPTDKEALEALEELEHLSQSEIGGRNRSNVHVLTDKPSQDFGVSSTRYLSQEEKFDELSQSYYRMHQSSVDDRSEAELLAFSQRVDRGETIVDGAFESIEDFIDSTTLTPHAEIDDDCGQLGDDDDLEMDEENLQQTLMTMATQTINNMTALDDESTDKFGRTVREESQIHPVDFSAAIPLDEPVFDQRGIHTTTTSKNDTLLPGEGKSALNLNFSSKDIRSLTHDGGTILQYRQVPPARKMMSRASATSLFPMLSSGERQPWLTFSTMYETFYSTAPTLLDFPGVPAGGVEIQLVRSPPPSHQVASWHSKRVRRSPSDNAAPNKRRRVSVQAHQKSIAKVDDNSRKLIFDRTDGTGVNASEVEEVEWRLSQNERHMMTQQSNEGRSQKSLNIHHVETHGAVSSLPSLSTSQSLSKSASEIETPNRPLQGIGNQGGRIWVEGGGLKANVRPTQSIYDKSVKDENERVYLSSPVSVMVLEIHVQCRTGRAGIQDSKEIAMTPDSSRDRVFSVVYVFGRDPGGGSKLEVLERGCLFIPVEAETLASKSSDIYGKLEGAIRRSLPETVLGVTHRSHVECVDCERSLLLSLASIVKSKDPDLLLSWDTQGAGIGYLIERGVAIGDSGRQGSEEVDMAKLLGRMPSVGACSVEDDALEVFSDAIKVAASSGNSESRTGKENVDAGGRWRGSGLGSEWDDRVGAGTAAASIVGRLVFAAWKIVAEEVKHPNVSYLQAVAYSVLGKRIPFHDNLKLTEWYSNGGGRERWRVIHYMFTCAFACLQLFDELDVIGRAGEAARLSGVELSQSFPGIRGSQYKVEGVLLRALQSLNSEERGSKRGRQEPGPWRFSGLSEETQSETQSPWKARRRTTQMEKKSVRESRPPHEMYGRGYFFFSPSLNDANRQEALQVQALTLEPQSGHQHDPVVVCDFTALYPSLVIAYNLCYSTIAGHFEYHSTRSEMRRSGRTTGRLGPFLYSEGRTSTILQHHVKSLATKCTEKDRAYVSPTGTIFVSEAVVKGVLPQLLDEILSTRAMLKKAAKQYRKLIPDLCPSIIRQLEARQLALKYVANVTYGYTSATFSGRCAMPLLADTIVECGRRTLTRAIDLANEWGKMIKGRWQGAEVLYGDTDSVFIRLPGRSVQEAFQFGEEFCRAVTESNPPPVQLKLEKVYLGSIMQTKKKYCGMKFDSGDQQKPTFEAKGLETIRRDQCSLTQKILRNSLITLFQKGIQAVKEYLYRQWNLIIAGRLPVSDFILSGRVRSRYRGGRVGPVQAALSRRLSEADPGRIVRHKERVPYVIVASPGKNFTLRDSVLTPMELLEQWDAYTINTVYYIKRHVNTALQRCLGLPPHNIVVEDWFASCPKPRRRIHFWPITRSGNSIMISSYFGSDICTLCGRKGRAESRSRAAVCTRCRVDEVTALGTALNRLSFIQQEAKHIAQRCSGCNLCFEDASTFGEQKSSSGRRQNFTGIVTPIANCTCIDCPMTFERHRIREAELEALAVCESLGCSSEG